MIKKGVASHLRTIKVTGKFKLLVQVALYRTMTQRLLIGLTAEMD